MFGIGHIAGVHVVAAAVVVGFAGAHRADDGHVLHLLGHQRHVLGDLHASAVVAIGLNSPPVGAPGLRSQMSIVAGPPPIHSMMADLCRFFMSVALASSVLVNDMAGTARADAPAKCVMKCRRVIPAGTMKQTHGVLPASGRPPVLPDVHPACCGPNH